MQSDLIPYITGYTFVDRAHEKTFLVFLTQTSPVWQEGPNLLGTHKETTATMTMTMMIETLAMMIIMMIRAQRGRRRRTVASHGECREFGISQVLLAVMLLTPCHVDDTNLKWVFATVLAAPSSSSSSSPRTTMSSSYQHSSSSSSASEEGRGSGTPMTHIFSSTIRKDDDHLHPYSPHNPSDKEQHLDHHLHLSGLQHHRHHLHHNEKTWQESQRQLVTDDKAVPSHQASQPYPWPEELAREILDENLLSMPRGNSINLENVIARDGRLYGSYESSSEVWALSFSPADWSLFSLLNYGLWKVDLNSGTASLAEGHWLNNAGFGGSFLQAFTMLDDQRKSGSSTSLNRVAVVAEPFNTSLHAYNVDHGSIPPPFSIVRYMPDAPGDSRLLSLAWDSNHRILYASTPTVIYRMNLSVSDGRNAVLERWVGPDLSSVGLQDGSSIPRAMRVPEPFLSSFAISADGKLLYVAFARISAIGRLKTSSGALEVLAKTGSPEGAEFIEPVGLALTSDGCHLFVSEIGGRLILVSLAYSGGPVVSVRTVAIARRPDGRSVTVMRSLALTQDDTMLYVGRVDYQIWELAINKSALPPWGGPYPGNSYSPSPPRSVSPSAAPSPSTSSSPSPSPSPSPPARPSALPSMGVFIGTSAVVLVILAFSAAIVESRRHCLQSWFLQCESQGRSLGLVNDPACPWPWSSRKGSDQKGQQRVCSTTRDGLEAQLRPAAPVKQYSFQEIREACDGLSSARLVGQGAAAKVYKGQLSNGQAVAVKMMKGEFSETKFRQFQAELDVLGTLRHSHQCSIIGYCAEGGKSFIIYSPFAEGGTLHDRLHCARIASTDNAPEHQLSKDEDSKEDENRVEHPAWNRVGLGSSNSASSGMRRPAALSWPERVSIAQQIGRALRYLHEEVDPPVIHRDVKSKNVLLEDRSTCEGGAGRERGGEQGICRQRTVRAFLSDFGLAKLGQSIFGGRLWSGSTVDTYHVAGTFGYIAPEYYTSCRLTTKNDVYAFGVVLLELITGRKPFGGSLTADGEGRKAMGVHEGRKKEEDNEIGSLTLTSWVSRMLGGSAPPVAYWIRSDMPGRSVIPALTTRITSRETFKERIQQIADPEFHEKAAMWTGVLFAAWRRLPWPASRTVQSCDRG
ncbi:hypothetical protein CBR_g26233 [Chara braunii]|uniref:Protein kinase domain-containing protein n=1 Tax=Chara braunii TaxID=69332 RepID=A0A388L7B2_CHABU|nr:hypothetical protein CBR_g26233 [Chara braunii]|eukprot:GBG78200.1 hypothetical protein CBR_g26233 [Chara braunii]